jgi:ABC-type polysaccharide/polyol phosphate export permease
LLEHEPPDWTRLVSLVGVSAILLALGLLILHRNESLYAKKTL